MDGVLVIDKPPGPTSHDVVATARRALRTKKIGHTGTLDPLASGVLPLVVGSATRLAQYLTATEKEYEATLRFGVETDSYDTAGRVGRETGASPSSETLVAALDRFRGAFDQTPPIYSAKKVGGDRAYELARRAKPVALAPVPVVVHALELLAFDPPLAHLRLVCSPGFYVRSLAHDLGQTVGTGAVLQGLRRLRSGEFTLDDAVPFEKLARAVVGRAKERPLDANRREGPRVSRSDEGPLCAELESRIVPMERLLLHWPAVNLTDEGVRRVLHGQELRPADYGDVAQARHMRLLSPNGRLVAIGERSKVAGFIHPVVVLQPLKPSPGGAAN